MARSPPWALTHPSLLEGLFVINCSQGNRQNFSWKDTELDQYELPTMSTKNDKSTGLDTYSLATCGQCWDALVGLHCSITEVPFGVKMRFSNSIQHFYNDTEQTCYWGPNYCNHLLTDHLRVLSGNSEVQQCMILCICLSVATKTGYQMLSHLSGNHEPKPYDQNDPRSFGIPYWHNSPLLGFIDAVD